MSGSAIRLVSLGGSGGFGLNATLLVAGNEGLLIDFGAGYPHPGMLGVERLVPDPRPLLGEVRTLRGVLLTHAHDDHVGALGHLPEAWRTAPVFGRPLALRVARDRCRETGFAPDLREAGDAMLTLGPFRARFLDVTHSVPQSAMILLETPAGRIVHSGDFKLDPTPVSGAPTDMKSLAAFGKAGVRLLLLDSTGARRAGRSGSERIARARVRDALRGVPGQILATTFSSHIDRIGGLLSAAREEGRVAGLIGRRMTEMVRHAIDLGLLTAPPGLLRDPEEVAALPPRQRLWLAGGCQGELGSSMSRISFGQERLVETGPGDRVIVSARVIPGAEPLVGRMVDRFLRTGAEVWHADDHPGLHVSGHGSREDLADLIRTLAPRAVVPVHGDRRHLEMAGRLAAELRPDAEVRIAESGEWLTVDRERLAGGPAVDLPPRLIDASGRPASAEVVRRRRRLARHGIVLIVLAGRGPADLHLEAHGIAGWEDDPSLRAAIEARARELLSGRPVDALEERLAREIGNLLRGAARFRPEVIVSRLAGADA